MPDEINHNVITCNNCDIIIKSKKNKLVANVIWHNGAKQIYTNEHDQPKQGNVFIIPHPDQGFYYLNYGNIMHIIDDVTKEIVVYDNTLTHNWFGKLYDEDIFYFPKYHVLICTFFGGDDDYIWWWRLNEYNQYANIEKPCYFNGVFNASLTMYKANDRYAVGTYYNYTDNDYESGDEDNADSDLLTIIFDTKKMTKQEYAIEELKNELGINKDIGYKKLQKKIIRKKYVD